MRGDARVTDSATETISRRNSSSSIAESLRDPGLFHLQRDRSGSRPGSRSDPAVQVGLCLRKTIGALLQLHRPVGVVEERLPARILVVAEAQADDRVALGLHR